jgi:hypothetical protein
MKTAFYADVHDHINSTLLECIMENEYDRAMYKNRTNNLIAFRHLTLTKQGTSFFPSAEATACDVDTASSPL